MLRENCQVLFASYLWAISIIPIIFFGKKQQQQQQQKKKNKERHFIILTILKITF